MFSYVALCVIGFLFGSIPSGVIFAKIFSVPDLRSHGSGNIGATNALRVGGKKLAILTLLLDVCKSAIPLLVIKELYVNDVKLLSLVGIFMVLGHTNSIFLNFKGGKGVATGFGVIIALLNPYLIATFACTWLSVLFITKYSSLSALISFGFMVILSYFFSSYFYAIFVIAALIFIKHKSNIQNLINGTESKIFKK